MRMAAIAPNGVHLDGPPGRDPVSELTLSLRRDAPRYLQPTLEHQQAAVKAAKAILDPLADTVAEAQMARRNESRRKRKRGSDEVEDPVLQLRQIYTNQLGVRQVWEQARRVLDAAYAEVERGIEAYLRTTNDEEKSVRFAERESGREEESQESDLDEEERSETPTDEEMLDGLDQGDLASDDGEDIEADSDVSSNSSDEPATTGPGTYKVDPNNLNDGFFSIDDFNKQSQFLEHMDARGDDENPSDEDEIDWDADPLAQPLPKLKLADAGSRGLVEDGEDDEDDDDDDDGEGAGPIFGNADLTTMDDDSDEPDGELARAELDGPMQGLENTNDIRYADFFEPPAKRLSKTKRMRALPKTQPPKNERDSTSVDHQDMDDQDLERAMADVRRDLLESDDELDDEDELSDVSDDDDTLPRLPKSKLANKNLSTHEKQQLQIAEEIRRLESLNVSKRPWTLSGEASAAARPINSLIEEDLDFERTGKPVPVITAEVSNDIEALIKRRILARDFDEVVRRGPTTLDSAIDARRGRSDAVVDDTKPTAGLGEIYEAEYQRNADPTNYIDKRSAATKKQHEEIDRLWKEVRDQLDVLGNLHFKPKRVEIEVKTVEDKPRIAMEDARPAFAGSGIDEDATMLAPQEIYKPGTDTRAANGEVRNDKSGASRSKEEMTREEKVRRRRREKERQKKSNQSNAQNKASHGSKPSKAAAQQDILRDLQKGGVQIVGKGGQLQSLSKGKKDVAPKQGHSNSLVSSGGTLKL